ncbi:MAG: acyltransferase family protein [Deltaproteobacteria bacterium]|nr:acyltransferase family protein [Deltaproteobacteria bacterium]
MDRVPANLGPYGVDPFGFDPEYLKKCMGMVSWIYHNYFRCQVFGVANVPEGRCLLVGNHSGQLPFDAAMVSTAVFLEREPPRFVRSMIERFVPDTPFISTFMARCGQILGTPENCRRVLSNGDAILVFPEGVGGLNKTWRDRYRLQEFGQGFMRLAIETASPIVPVAVIGAEEQAPTFINAKFIGKLFGVPAFPITPTNPLLPVVGLLPYPTRYRIYFGKPLQFTGDANDEDEVILKKVDEVKATMQAMIDDGLAAREHVFW